MIGTITKLSLINADGGGIRGYWTLLALKKLVEHIAEYETTQYEDAAQHSFAPGDYPEHVSKVARRSDEPRAQKPDDVSYEPPATFHLLYTSRRYLLCHYFDYIGGSSTGGYVTFFQDMTLPLTLNPD